MIKIELNGAKVLVDIVQHDSNEEPETACVNRMASIKVGERTYHHAGGDQPAIKALLEMVAADAALHCTPIPSLITVVVTSFKDAFSIDWPSTVSELSKLQAMGLTRDVLLQP